MIFSKRQNDDGAVLGSLEMLQRLDARVRSLEIDRESRDHQRRTEMYRAAGCLDPEAVIVILDSARSESRACASGYGSLEWCKKAHPLLWESPK